MTLDWWPAEKEDWHARTWARASVHTVGLDDPARFDALAAALRRLAPVALRVGGSLADSVVYDGGAAAGAGARRAPRDACGPFAPRDDRVAFEGGCLTAALWARLDALALAGEAPLVFALSGRDAAWK